MPRPPSVSASRPRRYGTAPAAQAGALSPETTGHAGDGARQRTVGRHIASAGRATAVQAPVRAADQREEIARAHARAERAETRADEAGQRADAADADRRAAIALAEQTVALLSDAVARADRAESAIAAERQRADALRDRLDGMQVQLAAEAEAADQARCQAQAAQDNAETLREAEAARKGRGRLARLRAAWRGE